MHLELKISDIPLLKTELRKSHPNIKASKRIEAAARGCSYKSYAAMRTDLQRGSIVIEPNNTVFNDYLGLMPNTEKSLRSLSHAFLRLILRQILEIETSLTSHGFDSAIPRFAEDRKLTFEQRIEKFEERRLGSGPIKF
ncbi:MAG: hypothetical protein OQJ97_08785 [Rhodospirillales bacterium]|nr:hypothetical protein [Rhodospirillales bacterium]